MTNRYLCTAKRLDNGEWVEGYLTIYEDETAQIHVTEEGWCYDVDPSTICQCTGYPNIWEKDIFQFDEERYVICFCEQRLAWEAVSIFSSESISLGEFSPEEIDVIGNEIDNPELLEVAECD